MAESNAGDRRLTRRRTFAARWPEALADAPRAPFWLARLLEESGEWLFLVWLLASGWSLSPDARTTGLLLAAWLVARPLLALAGERLRPVVGRTATTLLALGRGALVALTVLVAADRIELLLLAGLLFGGLSAWAGASRPAVLRRLFGGANISAAGAFDTFIGRLGFVLGPLAATLTMLIAPALAGWLAALALISAWLVFSVLVGWERRTVADRDAFVRPQQPLTSGAVAASEPAAPSISRFTPLVQVNAPTLVATTLAVGALVGGLLALGPQLAAAQTGSAVLVGVGLGVVGLGALLLRLPMARFRLHLPPVLLVPLVVLVVVLVSLAVGLSGYPLIVAPGLFVLGSLSAALDGELVVRLRRLGDRGPAVSRAMLVALGLGQLIGALAVTLLGGDFGALSTALALLAVGAVAVQGVALFADRAAIAAARHQVQQFSWNSNPAPRAAEPISADTRAGRLAGWITRQVEIELVDVTLPQSGRHYAIARPSGDGRDSLFEQAKRDPERQMPFWAKVWPSGVALADVVVERAAEVRDRQVLELGAGLGVTACTVLEEGGRLVTADYSLLPLALCRLNGLTNTGRGQGSICFNWRDEEQVREVLRRHPPIGLIIAADVLYEGRDVMPLVGVLERLLAAGGALWLAEPLRKTAQRFLDTVAALGWQVESRTIQADWPDATDGRVNVHVIRREESPVEAALGLGGWQL